MDDAWLETQFVSHDKASYRERTHTPPVHRQLQELILIETARPPTHIQLQTDVPDWRRRRRGTTGRQQRGQCFGCLPGQR